MTSTGIDFENDLRPEGADGRYILTIPGRYQGREGQPFGGITAAVAVRAAGHEAVHPRLASISLHYVRPLSIDAPIDIVVESLKQGRRAEVRRVTMEQAGKVSVHAVAVTTPGEPVHDFPGFEPVRRPTFPDPTGLPRMADVIAESGFELREDHNIRTGDARVPRDPDVRSAVAPDHEHHMIWAASYGMTAVSDDPWVEASRIAVLCDSHGTLQRAGRAADVSIPFPEPGSGVGGIVNLDLTIHFHPTNGTTPWLWSDGEASVAAEGLANGSCSVWSQAGDLLATAVTQVMIVPPRT